MKYREIIRRFLPIFTAFLIGLNAVVFGADVKYGLANQLEGNSKIGFLPASAANYCASIGGNLANLANSTEKRLFFMEELEKHCDPNSGFCPKMCAFDEKRLINAPKFPKNLHFFNGKFSTMTQPVFRGDSMFMRLQMKENSIEVLQLSNNLLDDLQNGSSQQVIVQLTIFCSYKDRLSKTPNKMLNGITLGTGFILKHPTEVENKLTVREIFHYVNHFSGVFDLVLRFNQDGRVEISSPQMFGNHTHEFPVTKLSGRVYFTKFYTRSRLLDAYFIRGNCKKSDFYHFPGNDSNDEYFVNCFSTKRPKTIIPVYSCRKASYVACENVMVKITKNVTLNATNPIVIVQPLVDEEYTFSDFMDEYDIYFPLISTLSLALLVTSIVLQIMKIRDISRKNLGKKRKSKHSKSSSKV